MRTFSLLLATVAFAQDVPWRATGGGRISPQDGAVAFTYEVKPRQPAAAIRPAPPGLAQMRRLRLRVKSDHDTAITVLLSEKKPGGGNYTAAFWAPAGAWQQVELAPADFGVTDGPNDPVDADGKLDLDAVEGIGIIDLASFFAGMPQNPDNPLVVRDLSGPKEILIGAIEPLVADASPIAPIDDFSRGFLQWMTPGGFNLSLRPRGNPLGEPALEAAYQRGEGEVCILLRRLGAFDLSQSTRISFDIASEREATLIVALESARGRRHTLQIFPPGAREVFHVSLKFDDFQGQGKIDPSQLRTLSIAAIDPAQNTLWIGNVR